MESLLKNLKQRLTCSICLDIYNEPKTISCLHTFCCECLSNHARASHRQGKFRCPECQAQIDLPEGNRFKSLPSSFFHNSLLSLLAIRRSGDGSNISCSQCRKNNSRMYYCFDCGKFMCPDCYNSHEMLKASFQGHKVTPVKEFKAEDYEALMKRQPFCSQQFHEKEITRFFCFSCQECVCQICIVTEPHRNHEVVLLDRAAHDEKPNIMSGAEMIKEKISELDEVIRKFEETISELDKNVATAKRGVSQAAEEMIAKIREREQEAIVLLETTRVTRLEGINSAMQEAQSLVRQMKQAVEFAYNLVQRSSSSDIMQNKDTLKQRFEVLRAVEVPKHNDTSFIEFWAATAENLKLGFIMVSEEEHGGYGGGGYGGGGYRQQQSSYRQYQQSNQQQRPRYQQNYNQQQQQSTAQTSYSPQQQYGTGAAYNQYYSYNQGYQATGYQQTGYAQQPQTYDQTAQQQGYMDYQNYHAGYRGGYI